MTTMRGKGREETEESEMGERRTWRLDERGGNAAKHRWKVVAC
jgi:hypothetical protein